MISPQKAFNINCPQYKQGSQVQEMKEIEKGRVKIHHYNSLKDFEKAIG